MLKIQFKNEFDNTRFHSIENVFISNQNEVLVWNIDRIIVRLSRAIQNERATK